MGKKVLHLILLSVVFTVTSQLSLKYGLKSVPEVNLASLAPFFQTVILNQYVLLGICLAAISATLWLMVLSKAELSYAYPMLSISYALTAISSWLLFNENLSLIRLGGIMIVCTGVYALSKS